VRSWITLWRSRKRKEEALESVLDMKFGSTCINNLVVSPLHVHITFMLLHVSAAISFFLMIVELH
jgi:hypothetical protein